MKYPLIALPLIGVIIITIGFNLMSGWMADLLILGILAVTIGPLRLLTGIATGIGWLFALLFRFLAIAGG